LKPRQDELTVVVDIQKHITSAQSVYKKLRMQKRHLAEQGSVLKSVKRSIEHEKRYLSEQVSILYTACEKIPAILAKP